MEYPLASADVCEAVRLTSQRASRWVRVACLAYCTLKWTVNSPFARVLSGEDCYYTRFEELTSSLPMSKMLSGLSMLRSDEERFKRFDDAQTECS